MAKKLKKPVSKKNKAPAAAPVIPPRELTRAEKTALAREEAAKRNAARVSPAVAPKAPEAPTSKPKVTKGGNKPTARRTLSSKTKVNKTGTETSRREINSKINTQTPTRRTEVRSSKKVSGSVKNIEIKHHSRTSKKSFRVKRKKQGIGRLLLGRLILFFIMFAIMFSIVAGLFSMSLKSNASSTGKEYTLQIGQTPSGDAKEGAETEEPVYIEIPKSCAQRYGNLYIPVSALTDICSLTVTGTPGELRYLPRDSEGHSMRFVVGSDIAYVNGAKVRMVSASFIHEGKLYIPLDFIQKYSKGLQIDVDDGNRKITVSKLLESYDAASDRNVYSSLTFNLSATLPLEPIPEPTA